jgi:hypothetical protein
LCSQRHDRFGSSQPEHSQYVHQIHQRWMISTAISVVISARVTCGLMTTSSADGTAKPIGHPDYSRRAEAYGKKRPRNLVLCA